MREKQVLMLYKLDSQAERDAGQVGQAQNYHDNCFIPSKKTMTIAAKKIKKAEKG